MTLSNPFKKADGSLDVLFIAGSIAVGGLGLWLLLRRKR